MNNHTAVKTEETNKQPKLFYKRNYKLEAPEGMNCSLGAHLSALLIFDVRNIIFSN